jgi:hypothetical protein
MTQQAERAGSSKEQALEFLRNVAQADHLSAEIQKGDVEHTVKLAQQEGYHIEVKDLWDAITELQSDRDKLARNVPSWIIDRLRVAVHD